MTLSANVPTELHDIVHDFAQTPQEQRLELLLEFSDEIPELPQRYADNPAVSYTHLTLPTTPYV